MLFRTVRIVKAGIFLMITLTLKEVETPTGVMRLGATEDALVLCDWPDAPGAPHCLKALCKRLGAVPVTGDSPILEKASKTTSRDDFKPSTCRFAPAERPSRKASGVRCSRFPTAKPPPTATSPAESDVRRLSGPSRRQWDRIRSASPFPATASSAPTDRSPGSEAVSTEKSSCSSSKAITAFDFS